MPLKKSADGGRRWVELEIELPGTPEQIWHAIATGPGISAWFVPTEVEPRTGGALAFDFGADGKSGGQVTAWEPPHRFAYEEPGWSGEAPPVATECVVQTRSGGRCALRMVHSLFTSSQDWDDQLEGFETGWPPFFAVLEIYLRHFAGQPAASARLSGQYPGPQRAAWEALGRALGLAGASAGERRETGGSGAPLLAGRVERVAESAQHCEWLLRLEQPAPGAVLLGAFEWGGRTNVAISLYFYGAGARASLASEGVRWQAWLDANFKVSVPAPGTSRS
jgi:uncharacterized protein YndB with AHSA1/START domain